MHQGQRPAQTRIGQRAQPARGRGARAGADRLHEQHLGEADGDRPRSDLAARYLGVEQGKHRRNARRADRRARRYGEDGQHVE